MKLRILARFFVFSSLAFFTTSDQAQQSLQVLRHHVRPAVSSGQAPLASSLPQTQRLNLAIVLPLRNQSELTSLLSRLYDPSSPDYRHFLSVDQFTQQFGPTAEDYQAVVDFAKANGFTVTSTPVNRMIVPISGSVAQVEKAFNVRMRNYEHPTENRIFYSPDREPSLNLSVPVEHISGLNNYSIPHPMVTKASADQVTANPAVLGSGPGGSYLASDMRAAYYTRTLPSGDTALTGSGQTVGLLEFDGYYISDVVSSFDGTATSSTNGSNFILNYTPTAGGTTYNIPVNNVLLDGVTGASASSNDAEETLDIVQAIGMAPGLNQVRVYIGRSDVDIFNSMAAENIAKQISISWGWAPDDPSTDDSIFQEFAAQGQSLFAASGDDGAFDAQVSAYFYPAEDYYVTDVGGTHLTTNVAGGPWVSETAWNSNGHGSGGGISPDGIPIPSWQSGTANASNGGSTTLRNVPDVAAEGDFDNYDCDLGRCAATYAGTSFAAPRWAGFMALVNQQAVAAGNSTVGFINSAIYAIGKSSNYGSDLHDITVGNNDTDSQPAWYSAVTGYDLVTGWGSPSGQNLIDALAGPRVPGFWIVASSGALSITQGYSGTSSITVNRTGGFTGSVDLAVTSGLPSGVTASWSANPTTGSSVLTLTASNSATPGTTSLIITATSGTLTATTTVALTINAPNFTLSAWPSGLPIIQGTSGKSTVTVTPINGFSGSVNLSASGLPSGVTALWSSNPTTGLSVLTLTASSAASLGQATVTITGISDALTKTTSLDVTVRTVPTATTTALTVTANGATVTSVTAGTVVTLTAAASAGSATMTTGQVKFCDATAAHCEDIHVLGTAQLTSAGTAVLKFTPGIGSHSYKAVFVGTTSNGSSSSAASALTVTAAYPSTTTIAQSGVPGNYTLSATVAGQGAVSPTGTISFLDTSNANAVLGSEALGSGQTALGWLNPQSPVTGSYPIPVVVGDFNGDGVPDLAVVNAQSNSVTILLGKGDGTFTPAPSLSTGSGPFGIAVGDFLGNGILDLAIANDDTYGTTLTILLGKGDGTFTPAPSPSTGTNPVSVAVGDFNGDGIPDLAVANAGSNTVTILLGNGDGTFTASAVSPPTGIEPISVAVGDFNGDGIPDLAVANLSSDTVTILLGNGDGTFALAPSLSTGSVPYTLAVGDFNEDGKADLAVVNAASDTVTVLLGNGDGTFTPTASPSTGTNPWSVAVADFNGDGKADLAVTNFVSNTVTVLLGNGDGTFTPATSPGAGSSPYFVAVGDFNGDGIPDLAVTNYVTNGTVTVLTTQLTQKVTVMATGISLVGTGTHEVDASYPGDSRYGTSISGTTGLTAELPAPTVTATPNSFSITTAQPLSVAVAVSGTPTPTGSVKLTGGGYTATQTLGSGSTTFNITAGSLSAGSDTFTANYTPDSNSSSTYNSATGTSSPVSVTAAVIPSFTVAGTSVTVEPGATTGNTSTITITPSGGFTGSVALTAAITSSPAGAQYPPTFSFGSTTPLSITGSNSGTATLTVYTTAATSASLANPVRREFPWYSEGGAALACILLIGIPARRRRWRTMLGLLALLVTLTGGLLACGGGGSGSVGSGGNSNPGTTAGTYTITVTGTSGTTTTTGPVTLIVQ